jgi:hypothetical protein
MGIKFPELLLIKRIGISKRNAGILPAYGSRQDGGVPEECCGHCTPKFKMERRFFTGGIGNILNFI